MNLSRKWSFIAVLVACLALLIATNALCRGRGVTKDTIRMGLILVKT